MDGVPEVGGSSNVDQGPRLSSRYKSKSEQSLFYNGIYGGTMANPKALQPLTLVQGKLGALKSRAPSWGRASVIHEHGSGEKSFSPLAQSTTQELSQMSTTPSVGAHHIGMTLHDDLTLSERRHYKRNALKSPHFAH